MSMLTRRLKEEDIVIDQAIRKQCFDKGWVVHSKPPAKGVNQVLEYIGRYAFRVAISNSRIQNVTDKEISYDYKMYRSGGKHGVMTIYLEICIEKGWDIGICKDCNCQRIITRIIKPAPRAPPYLLWRLVK